MSVILTKERCFLETVHMVKKRLLVKLITSCYFQIQISSSNIASFLTLKWRYTAYTSSYAKIKLYVYMLLIRCTLEWYSHQFLTYSITEALYYLG